MKTPAWLKSSRKIGAELFPENNSDIRAVTVLYKRFRYTKSVYDKFILQALIQDMMCIAAIDRTVKELEILERIFNLLDWSVATRADDIEFVRRLHINIGRIQRRRPINTHDDKTNNEVTA